MSYLKFIASLLTAALFVLAFRALAFTIYAMPCTEKDCGLVAGDRIVVNRWSYGLRTGDDKLFAYARLFPSEPKRGDVIAFNPPSDSTKRGFLRSVLVGRVKAVPGDTVGIGKERYSMPSTPCPMPCLGSQYYLVYTEGGKGKWLVPEKDIIGRAQFVLYSMTIPSRPFVRLRKDRILIPIR